MAPASEGNMLDSLSYNLKLKLDLHNFEDPRYEDGKYVLTSPRSLEACSRLNIKPVEILYKPLAEFQEELLPRDVPLRSIFNIYDDQEQERMRKLRRCREERRKIISEDFERPRDTTSVTISRDPHYGHYGGGDATEGTVQRERTKWVTSIGHDRVTRAELDRRARQLYEESFRPATVADKYPGKRKKNRTNKGNRSISRSQSANSSRMSQNSRLTASSSSGVRKVTSRPIRNSQSQETQNGLVVSESSIPKRDQKILQLMKAKGEEDKKYYTERNLANLSWDEERRRQLAIQNKAENSRRHSLNLKREEWETFREEQALERTRLDETVREQRERTLDHKLISSQSLLDQTLRSKNLQIEEKKRQEYLRKKSQENNKAALNQDEVEMRNLIRQKQRLELDDALNRKESKLTEECQRKKFENSEKERSYSRRRAFIHSLNSTEAENLRSSINMKHAHASTKYEQVLNDRDLQLSLSQRDRAEKQRRVEQNHKQQEMDMEQWRHSLSTYRQSLGERASDVLNRTNQIKAEKAAKDRREKEQLQKVNIKKVANELEAWRRSTENHLEVKHRRAEEIQSDRESTINRTRAIAHATEAMRDELRQKYAADSFDKKALKAEQYNKMGLGLLGKTNQGKTKSSVKLAYM